jgi:ubiquinone biosynthesis protein COQ9
VAAQLIDELLKKMEDKSECFKNTMQLISKSMKNGNANNNHRNNKMDRQYVMST